MIECSATHAELKDLFAAHIPNDPALWVVLQGKYCGRAMVDNLDHPTQALIRTDAVLTYASRGVEQDFLGEAINHLRQKQRIWLIRSEGDPTGPKPEIITPRLEFMDCDALSTMLADIRNQLPAGYAIRNIDRQLLERCEWRDDMAFYCGSLDNFVRFGIGLCMMDEDEIIVEAYASALGKTHAEIGAITHERYRGRGYAPITVAFLIEALERRGYQAYWSCDLDNPASARVARKLGFKVEKPYEIWEYRPQDE